MYINILDENKNILEKLGMNVWDCIFWQAMEFSSKKLEELGVDVSKVAEQEYKMLSKFRYVPQGNDILDKEVIESNNKLKQIKEVLDKTNYPASFKYLILSECLTNKFKKKIMGGKIKFDISPKERAILPEISMEISPEIVEYIYNKVGSYEDFSTLYSDACSSVGLSREIIEKLKSRRVKGKNSILKLNNVKSNIIGEWIEFKGKVNDPENFAENTKILCAISGDVCCLCEGKINNPLDTSDYYIYVDEKGKARVSVRMFNNFIESINLKTATGVDYLNEMEIAIDLLKKNENVFNADDWLDKFEWVKRLSVYSKKLYTRKMTIKQVPDLINDLTRPVFRYDFSENNLKFIYKKLGSIKDLIALYYNCDKDEVYVGDWVVGENELKKPIKIVIGDVIFDKTTDHKDFLSVEKVFGNVNFENFEYETLEKLDLVTKEVDLYKSNIKSLGSLKKVGSLNAEMSILSDLGELTNVQCNLNIRNSYVKNLGKVSVVGSCLEMNGTDIKNLGEELKKVGTLDLNNLDIEDTGGVECVGILRMYNGCKLKDLSKLKKVGNLILDPNENYDFGGVKVGKITTSTEKPMLSWPVTTKEEFLRR